MLLELSSIRQFHKLNLTDKTMSSRKKITLDQIPLFSVTEKLREKSTKSQFSRQCCQKQNCHSKEKHPRVRDFSHSSKKLKKKKYLQEEVEKLLQKRYCKDDNTMNQIKLNNTSELHDLRGDLKEMKNVLSKLSTEQWHHKRQTEEKVPSKEEDYGLMCTNFHMKIDDLTLQLEVQKEVNSKLEEAHINSQLLAKQTKQFSESLTKECMELTSKHIDCENNRTIIEEQVKLIQSQKCQAHQLLEQLKASENDKKSQQTHYQELQSAQKEELNTIREENMTLFNEKRTLLETQTQLEHKIDILTETIVEFTQATERTSNKDAEINEKKELLISQLQKQNQELVSEKEQVETQLNRLQSEFNATKTNLGNTESKLNGLFSMEKKCEQLYQEIKNEKKRWDYINIEASQEKEALQKGLKSLHIEKDSLALKIESIKDEMKDSQELISNLKVENERGFHDKVKLSKQIQDLEKAIDLLEEEKEEVVREKGNIVQRMERQEYKLRQKQIFWQKQNSNLEAKLDWLEKQKTQLETEVKGTLEVSKKRNDEISAQNMMLHNQISELKDHNKQLNTEVDDCFAQNQIYKAAIGVKEQKIIDIQFKLKQKQATIETILGQNKENEDKQKESNIEWLKRMESIHLKLEASLDELKDCRLQNQQLSSQLTNREEKIVNLSSLQQILEIKVSEIGSKLDSEQTARLELSSELELYQSTSRRNEQTLREEKVHYESQVLKKNITINDLKNKIMFVKEESFKIQEDMKEYNKMEMLEFLFEDQLKAIEGSIKYITQQKNELQLQLNILKAQNNDLSSTVFRMEEANLCWPQQKQEYMDSIHNYMDSIHNLEGINQQLETKTKEQGERIISIERVLASQSQTKEKEVFELQIQLKEERIVSSEKLIETSTSISESNRQVEILLKDIKDKQQTISEANEKMKHFEDKKTKVAFSIQDIQNQITELSVKNNQIELDNHRLGEDLNSKNQIVKHFEQKVILLQEANNALQDQSSALNEQSNMFRQEIIKLTSIQKSSEEQSLQKIHQVYVTCEARKEEATSQLKLKISELANELSSCITKLNLKNTELQANEIKCNKLQQLLKESQLLLTEQKTKIEQSFVQIESLKYQINGKDRDFQTLNRDKTILREKLSEQQSKYQILRRKFDHNNQEKVQMLREFENQSFTIKILKEQNLNIEKVMSEQISQRKVIIQQLVNEKRMLYSQLNHEQ